jgi:hypothetical protein
MYVCIDDNNKCVSTAQCLGTYMLLIASSYDHPSLQTIAIDPLVAAWEGEHARLAVTFDPSDIGTHENTQHCPRHYMLRHLPITRPYHSLLILHPKSFSPHLSRLPSTPLSNPPNSTLFKSHHLSPLLLNLLLFYPSILSKAL